MTRRKESMMSAQQPEELHQLFVACVNAHDVDALLALYEPDCTVADLEGHPLQGRDNLRAFLMGFLAVVKQIDGGTRKVLVSGNIALLSSTYHALLATHDGEMTSLTGTSAEVARRQPDGTWRFLIDDPQFVNASPQIENCIYPRAGLMIRNAAEKLMCLQRRPSPPNQNWRGTCCNEPWMQVFLLHG